MYSKLSYTNAVGYVPIVGRQLAAFLVTLESQCRIQYDSLHLVGFNLGSHVVGIAGREVFLLRQQQVARITGILNNIFFSKCCYIFYHTLHRYENKQQNP